MIRRSTLISLLALVLPTAAYAQVSSYTFSAEVGNWQPLGGSGSLLGMPGMPPEFDFYDDNSFVTEGESILLGTTTVGKGWPIGFTFHFNGQPYDRVGLSIEGWLAFGHSSAGTNAVYVPAGSTAYTPLSSGNPAGTDPLKRNRIAAFAMDLRAQGAGGTWPLQLRTSGTAPNRLFVAEWNVVRSGGSTPLRFQIRLNEGGGDPAQQTVQVVYGSMTASTAHMGQVGLGGTEPSDFNNRAVTASPYDWLQSVAGTSNTATCRLPATGTYLPAGLTFTWTPAACLVTNIATTNLAMTDGSINATLSWDALAGATSYDYIITAGGPEETPLLSGTGLTGTSVELEGLPAGELLFAYVKADCAGTNDWGTGYPFSTENIVEVPCGEPALSFAHCYANLEQTTWRYTSSSGAPLRMFIHAGAVYSGDLLQVFDGNSDQAPLLFSSTTGAVAGQMITSTGGAMTMKLIADELGSCSTTDFILPLEWEIGCLDCSPVLATFEVVNDCPNEQFSVDVSIFDLGSSASSLITSNGAAPAVQANGTGTYTVGPFPIGTPVLVTAEHDYNDYCSATSQELINAACPVVGCGPDLYTYCYGDDDESQFAFQAGDGFDRIGIRFLSGTLAGGDVIYIFDGLDPFMSLPLFSGSNNGNLTNLMVTTNLTNADRALLLEVASNSYNSCATGNAEPWKYVVACYDGCTPPTATFTTVRDCNAGTFSVAVEVDDMGSAGSLSIQNDAGAAAITAQAAGTYTVGPFTIGQEVVVEISGESILCGINSLRLGESCDVGIEEQMIVGLHIFPNPGDGAFRLVMPEGFGGQGQLEVLDITGRSVAGWVLQGVSGRGVDCNLGYLPAGRYLLTLTDGVKRAYAPITIVR